MPLSDWDDSVTELGKYNGAQANSKDRLWEDNWDDDDIDEEFNLQLRYVSRLTTECLCGDYQASDFLLVVYFIGMNWLRRDNRWSIEF